MGLLDDILSAQGGGLITQIAKNFGIDESAARGAVTQMLPAVSRGIQKNAASSDGLSALISALGKGNHNRYVENADELSNSKTADDGNAILGHIFGNNKDVSRNVAGHAAQQTGLDSSLLKKMLPLIATVAMGALSKQSSGSGALASMMNQGGGSVASDLLTSFLDADNDGSVADDLIGLARKFF